MLRNLTPHNIDVVDTSGLTTTITPDGQVARVEYNTEPALAIDGIPIVITTPNKMVGLPAPESGIYLIVSSRVVDYARELGRSVSDLLVPHEQIRNTAGQPIGCAALARLGSTAPRNLTETLAAITANARRVGHVDSPHGPDAGWEWETLNGVVEISNSGAVYCHGGPVVRAWAKAQGVSLPERDLHTLLLPVAEKTGMGRAMLSHRREQAERVEAATRELLSTITV